VRPLGIIHARGKPLAPTVRRFIDLLRGHAHDTDLPFTGFTEAADPMAGHAAAHT